VRLALRWIGKINLGDEVIHQGKRWTLIQGVSNPYWNLARDGEYLDYVHHDQFRKVKGLRAAWRSFHAGYRFYMTSWYSIWVREGIKPWMLACNIWSGKLPSATQETERGQP
jgi:hypothetical protein